MTSGLYAKRYKSIIFSKENIENIEFIHKVTPEMNKKRIKYYFSDIFQLIL